MGIVRLAGGARRSQGVLGQLHVMAPRDSADPDIHEQGVLEETIVVRGVAVAVRQTP